MSLTIQISDQLAAELEAKAKAEGMSPDSYVGQAVQEKLDASSPKTEPIRLPLKNCYGILAKYGPGPSGEEIDAARKELWGHFPAD